MSDKIALDDVASGYNLSKINVNFDKIETELNEKVLYRDPPDGAPNEMSANLDMNGNKIYNLAKPTSPHEPLRLIDAAEIAAGGEFPINTTISSSGSGASLVRDPEGVIRSLTGVGHIQTVVDGDDMLITTTAEANTASSLGTGTPIYANKVGANLLFKSVKAGTGVSLYDSGSEITISSTGGVGSGEVNTASSLGTGEGVFKTKSGVDLQFKSLKAGTNVTLSSTADEVTINATGGGGGGTWDGFADITNFGAVGDFIPLTDGGGTGTNNDTAVMNAIATGKPLWIPAGDFFVNNTATNNAYAVVSSFGPGKVWGNTTRGKMILGKTLLVGANNTHEINNAGGIKWASGSTYNGVRSYLGHHNWQIHQPDNGPMQFQLYPGYGGKGYFGTTAHFVSPNKIVADMTPFDLNMVRVGNHIGFAGVVYKVASVIDTTNITVTNFDGSAVSFTTDTTPRPFYVSYECAVFTGNTSGTTVTRTTGDALPYGFGGDHMYCLVNGTYYQVTSGPETTGDGNKIILYSSAGTQTNASIEYYRVHGPWAYISLFRLQGLGGGIETNGGMMFNIKNQLRIFNGGAPNDPMTGDIKVNATKVILGQGDGGTDDELVEIGQNYLTLGGRPGTTTRNYVEVDSLGSSIAPIMKAAGAASNMNLVLDGKGSGGVQFGTQANNIVGISAPTLFAPSLAVRGADSNPDFGFDLKGNGSFRFTAGTYGRVVGEIVASASSTGYAQLVSGTNIAYVNSAGTATNVDLALVPKGTAGRLLPKGLPYCCLRRINTTTLPYNTGTILSWDTEDSDPFGMHAAGSSIITAPVSGLYRLSTGFLLTGTSGTDAGIITSAYVIVNGTAVRNSPFIRHRVPSSTTGDVGSDLSMEIMLNAGDQVQIQAYYGTTAALNGSLNVAWDKYNYFNMSLITSF